LAQQQLRQLPRTAAGGGPVKAAVAAHVARKQRAARLHQASGAVIGVIDMAIHHNLSIRNLEVLQLFCFYWWFYRRKKPTHFLVFG